MAPAGPELAGSCCHTVGIGDCNPPRRRRAPDGDPLYNCKSARDFALTGCTTVLCAAHGRAHAGRPYSFSDLYLHLRDAGRKESPRRDGAHTTPGCPSVGADPRLSLIHGRVLHLAVSATRSTASWPTSPVRSPLKSTSCFRLPRRCRSWNLPNSRKAPSN